MIGYVDTTTLIIIFSIVLALLCWILAEVKKSYVLFLISSGSLAVFSILLMENIETTEGIALFHVVIWLIILYLGSVGIYNSVIKR